MESALIILVLLCVHAACMAVATAACCAMPAFRRLRMRWKLALAQAVLMVASFAVFPWCVSPVEYSTVYGPYLVSMGVHVCWGIECAVRATAPSFWWDLRYVGHVGPLGLAGLVLAGAQWYFIGRLYEWRRLAQKPAAPSDHPHGRGDAADFVFEPPDGVP